LPNDDDPLLPSWLHPLLPQPLHDALAAVRGSGKYYGGAPQVPGPAVRVPMSMAAEPPAIGWNSVEPLLQRGPSPPAANQNITRGLPATGLGRIDERHGVLSKLIANRDFRPSVQNGRLWFKSLSPSENEVFQRIGWARAPEVTFEEEMSSDPLVMRRAWERNIRHWLELASPKE